MKLIDSHVHLDMEPLSGELPAAIERAQKAGVEKMINIGSSLRGSERSVEIAEKYPNIWATVGLHPHEAGEILDLEGTIEKLEALAKGDRVVAIGEIGLDYYNSSDQRTVISDQQEKQKELFKIQLDLAQRNNLPVVIHIRDAWEDFFTINRSSKFKNRNSSRAIGVIHCFTGDEKIAKKAVEAGFCLGFTGFVTFKQDKFNHIRKAVQGTPIEKILIETDAPFLAPEPYRGKPNEPAYVVEVAKKIASLKKISPEQVAEATNQNTEKLFDI